MTTLYEKGKEMMEKGELKFQCEAPKNLVGTIHGTPVYKTTGVPPQPERYEMPNFWWLKGEAYQRHLEFCCKVFGYRYDVICIPGSCYLVHPSTVEQMKPLLDPALSEAYGSLGFNKPLANDPWW